MYEDDVYSYIRKMIYEETIYLRHYYGFVVNNIDPINPKSGKIQCLVEELEWTTPDVAAWCNPRQMNSMSVPNIGETVEIYFMNADCERPVYIGQAAELESRPKSYTAPTKAVIYENPITGDRITFNLLTKSIDIKGGVGTEINISAGAGGKINLDPGPAGTCKLGAAAGIPVNNFPVCLFTGAPHSTSLDTKA